MAARALLAIHHDYLVVRQVCHDHSPPPPLSPGRAEVVSGSAGPQPTRRPRLAPGRLTPRLRCRQMAWPYGGYTRCYKEESGRCVFVF
ncbi:unnamed protein product [Boreogadus saida]